MGKNRTLPQFCTGAVLVGVVAAASVASAAEMPAKAPAAVAVQEPGWDFVFNSEVRYFSWKSSRGYPNVPTAAPALAPPAVPGSGSLLYVPWGVQLTNRSQGDAKVEFLARGGYIQSRQSTPGISGEVATQTDTILSGTVTHLGWAGIQPFFSFNLNLPTGKTVLSGTSANARQDSDLVDTPTFGEGFNIGPTVGANIPITSDFIISVGVGHTNRGAFDRDGSGLVPGANPTFITRLDPGDVTTFNAGFGWQIGSLTLQGSVAYALETKTTLDGLPFYRSGPRLAITGIAGYAWSDALASKVNVSYSRTGKNDVFLPPGPPFDLVREAFNSNSDVIRVYAETLYRHANLSIGPTGSFLYRNHNSWDPTNFQFIPAKTSWAAGGLAQLAVNQQATLTLRAEHRWTFEDENPDKIFPPPPFALFVPGSGIPAISSRGWLTSVGGILRF